MRRNHLTPEQANLSVPKNVITRSLGPEPNIEVDLEGPLAVELGDVFLLCSDGLSGPVNDQEIGAFAGNFHPRDACRYLVNLANLRGGLDNITVLIVRIGPWVDPDSAESAPADLAAKRSAERRKSPLVAGSAGRDLQESEEAAGHLAPEEEHRYRSTDCPINEALIDRLSDLTERAREIAIEQAWSVDWTELADRRKQARRMHAQAHNDWLTLRELGEIIAMLGQAARFHRKSTGAAPNADV